MTKSTQRSAAWLDYTYVEGVEGMTEIFSQVCNGQISPEKGIIVKP